jgi:hypothetical protein
MTNLVPPPLPAFPCEVRFWLDTSGFLRLTCNGRDVYVRAFSFPLLLHAYFGMKLDMLEVKAEDTDSYEMTSYYRHFVAELNQIF